MPYLAEFHKANDRQIKIASTATPAVILMNSAAFLALLNKLDFFHTTGATKLAAEALQYWSYGIAAGVCIWLFSYLNALSITTSINNPQWRWAKFFIYGFLWLGALSALVSIACFLQGTWLLTDAMREPPNVSR